jgi:hypothetical protein
MPEFAENLKYDHAFVVVRVDEFLEDSPIEVKVSLVKALWSQEDAEVEVKRLNELNADKGCYYYWQVVRIERRSESNSDRT